MSSWWGCSLNSAQSMQGSLSLPSLLLRTPSPLCLALSTLSFMYLLPTSVITTSRGWGGTRANGLGIKGI